MALTLSPQPLCEKPTTAALILAPLQNRQVPGGPFADALGLAALEVPPLAAKRPIELGGFRIGVVVFLEPQQAQVPGVLRGEAGDLDVVAHQVVALREFVDVAGEELFLVVPARSPREHATDVEVFAENVPHHVFRLDALAGHVVVLAAGGVDVVVAGEPAVVGKLNPPLEPKRLFLVFVRADGDFAFLDAVFRTAGVGHLVFAGWQTHRLTAIAIDLVVKEHVGRQPAGPRRVNAAQRVADHKLPHSRRAVVVDNVESHLHGRAQVNKTFNSLRKPRSCVPWPTSKENFASRLPASRLYSATTRYSNSSPESDLVSGCLS